MDETGICVCACCGPAVGECAIYRVILDKRSVAPVLLAYRSAAPVSPPKVSRDTPFGANELAASKAISERRAKCVNGVVYRTYDHVIEPWPGDVRCFAAEGVAGPGPSYYGVIAQGH